MRRRLLLFSFGAFISIFFLSLGPENRLKDTFYAYLDYFNINKRVITHLINDNTSFSNQAKCQLVYYKMTENEILSVLVDGKVNFDLSNEDGEPCQYFLIENNVNGKFLSVEFELCYYNNKSVSVISFSVDDQKDICNL